MSTKNIINASLYLDKNYEITIKLNDDVPYDFIRLLERTNNRDLARNNIEKLRSNKTDRDNYKSPERDLYSKIKITKSGRFSLGIPQVSCSCITKDTGYYKENVLDENGHVQYDYDNLKVHHRDQNINQSFYTESLQWRVKL